MAKPNYSYQKYQKELAKKKKQEEKKQRKLAKKSQEATEGLEHSPAEGEAT